MELSYEQKVLFYKNGFIQLPQIVPSELVENALWAINNSLGENGIRPEDLVKFRNQSYCPELITQPVILDLLYRSPLFSIAENLVGTSNINPVDKSQIALRFPNTHTTDKLYKPHLDGLYTPLNGVEKGTVASFTGLIGVFLSDVPHENMSNFTVWPGSHRQYEEYFQQNGSEQLLNGATAMPDVPLNPPQQILAKAGDAILCHYQLGHSVIANASPYIRYAVFFRFWRKDHLKNRPQQLTNIWLDWDGMREVVEKEKAQQ